MFLKFLPLLLVLVIDSIGLGILFPILNPIFMDANGIMPIDTSNTVRNFYYGLTLCVFPLAMFIGCTFLGDISDQVGRKPVLLICLIGALFSYLLSGIAIDIGSLALLIFSRVIAGLTAASQPIAQAAVVDLSTPDNKNQNLSLMIFAVSLGFIIGPLMGGFLSNENLMSQLSLSTPLYAAAIICAVGVLLILTNFRETFQRPEKVKLRLFKGPEIFIQAFKSQHIQPLAFIHFFMQLGWGCYFQFVSLFLMARYAYSSGQVGLFISAMACGFAFGACCLNRFWIKRFSTKALTWMPLGIMAVLMFLTVLTHNLNLTWAAMICIALSMSIGYPSITTLLSNQVDETRQGWIMGIMFSIFAVAWTITSFISGFLQSLNQGAPLTLGAMGMLMAFVLMSFRLKSPDAPAKPAAEQPI